MASSGHVARHVTNGEAVWHCSVLFFFLQYGITARHVHKRDEDTDPVSRLLLWRTQVSSTQGLCVVLPLPSWVGLDTAEGVRWVAEPIRGDHVANMGV